MNKKFGAAFVIAAGVFWGIISIFVKKLEAFGFSSAEIGFSRVLVSAFLMLILLLLYDRRLLRFRLRDVWMFVGTGIVSVTLFCTCYFTTMITAGASVAVSLLYTSPVFIMLGAAILFREKITGRKIIGIVLTVLGVVFVSGMVGDNAKMSFSSLLIGIGAGFFYALYSIFGRYATNRYHPFTVTFYTFVFSTLGFLVIAKPWTIVQKIAALPGGKDQAEALGVTVLSAFLCSLLPYLFYTLGLKSLDTTVAGILVAVEPLVGSVIGIALFREDAGIVKILGILLILSSIVLLSLPAKGEKTTAEVKNREK